MAFTCPSPPSAATNRVLPGPVPVRPHRRLMRSGFSLVELFAVVAILGTLLSLILPAVQRVRESSRRSQCVNNLKNMGAALANHDLVTLLHAEAGRQVRRHVLVPFLVAARRRVSTQAQKKQEP